VLSAQGMGGQFISHGNSGYNEKSADHNVRCVRGGQFDDLVPPTITSFTSSGETQTYSELIFFAEYSANSGSTIVSVEYDYLNDGTWVSANKYTYTQAGTYQVKLKVTDSNGEFTQESLELSVADAPFENLPLSVQLQTYITIPEELTSVEQNIQNEINSAIAACKADPSSCDIKPSVVVIPMY